MIFLSCGIIIGTVMGLTGAGGALIAIPLFIQFMGMSLKEASVYSLIAVVVASLMNFVAQRKETQYFAGLVIVVASAVGSYVSVPFKEMLSSLHVAIILAVVSIYALYSVWMPTKINFENNAISSPKIGLSVIVGLLLGGLTTFTGLGGGVLMLPIFLDFFHFSQPQSVATSLFAVGLSSLASLLVQISRGAEFGLDMDIFLLGGGILVSAYVLKHLSRHLSQKIISRSRQVVFTFVVVLALSKIF